MERVGVRELKNRLSEYLRRVDHGEVILVTDRGRPVAEIRKPEHPPPGWEGIEVPSRLWEMLAQGAIRLGRPGPRSHKLPPGPSLPDGTGLALLDQGRDEH